MFKAHVVSSLGLPSLWLVECRWTLQVWGAGCTIWCREPLYTQFYVFDLHICLSGEVAQQIYLKDKDAKAHTAAIHGGAQVKTQAHPCFALCPQSLLL